MPITETPTRVLLATDGSPAARCGEQWVSRLPWSEPPVVDVLCVASRAVTRLGWSMDVGREPLRSAVASIRQAESLAAQRIANEVGERLQAAGVRTRTWTREGNRGEELLAMIDEERPDLVVAGPRGRSGLAAAILGSTTNRLIERATRPTLIARAPVPDGELPHHAVVLVDGLTVTNDAVRRLIRFGWVAHASVTLVGLVGTSPGLDEEQGRLADEVTRLVEEDATAALEVLGAPLVAHGAAVGFQLRHGHPLRAALEAIDMIGADLVVMASPPRGSPERLAADVARHATASVLLVPPGEAAETDGLEA